MLWFVWIGAALLLGRYLQLFRLDEVSGWWFFVPFAVAAFWFEIVERRMGFDRKKAFDELDRAKKRRIEEALQRDRIATRLRR